MSENSLNYLLKHCHRDPEWAAAEIVRLKHRTCKWKFTPNSHWTTGCGIKHHLFACSIRKYCPDCGGKLAGDDIEDHKKREKEQFEKFFEANPHLRENKDEI